MRRGRIAFAQGGQPLAGGLALVDPPPSMAIAFNAAPGTVAPDEQGPYGAYATALTEMIGAGGLSLDDIFARVRLRVSEQTQGARGALVRLADRRSVLHDRTRGRRAAAAERRHRSPTIRNRPMRDFGNPDDAYAAALALDTIDGYEQFLAVYPDSPYSQRVAAMIAVRREEIAWRHCVMNDTPPAYWSYLRRYPNGPHMWDARRRLAFLRAEMEPPPDFAMIDFGVPPPPPDEMGYIDRPFIMFGGLGFRPPPRPPVFFLPPRPREFVVLPPPPPPRERFALPIPGCRGCSGLYPAAANRRRASGAAGSAAGTGRPSGIPRLVAGCRSARVAGRAQAGTPGTPGTRPGFGTPAARPGSCSRILAPARRRRRRRALS